MFAEMFEGVVALITTRPWNAGQFSADQFGGLMIAGAVLVYGFRTGRAALSFGAAERVSAPQRNLACENRVPDTEPYPGPWLAG